MVQEQLGIRIARNRIGTAHCFKLWACAVLALMCLCGSSLFAQEFRGTISGAVTDPSGALVSGASIEVRETHTATINRTTSDSAGQYVVPFLLPGDYSITVTKKGFEILTRKGIVLQAQEHPIINLDP